MGKEPVDGMALSPLPDTSIHDDAPKFVLSARSHVVGCWICAALYNTAITNTNVCVILFISHVI
ncbi:MAG: hypothetical protein J6X12_08270 [Paludibacteraceae bacterium]|nr:hypothetical protein [Paludibacteraceae bacterium]